MTKRQKNNLRTFKFLDYSFDDRLNIDDLFKKVSALEDLDKHNEQIQVL